MSGGSFNYLYRHLQDPYHEAEFDAERMIEFMKEHDMEDAAQVLYDFFHRPQQREELINLVQAIEWFTSCDWSYDEVMVSYAAWKKAKNETV